MDREPEIPGQIDGDEKTPPHKGLSPLVRRRRALGGTMLASAVGFFLALFQFDVTSEPRELEFGQPVNVSQFEAYIQPVQVDPLNSSMQFRLSIATMPSLGAVSNAPANRDLVLNVSRGNYTDRIAIQSGQPYPEVTLAVDLNDGTIRNYPLDRYSADISLSVQAPNSSRAGTALPLRVKIWDSLLGWQMRTTPRKAEEANSIAIRLLVKRTGATAFFGLALYGAMVVLAICGLALGSLVYLGLRKIEVTLIGSMVAMVFALPALRNAMPSSPPIGIRADVFIFFWAELAAVIALCMLVIAWARRGPNP